MIAQEVAQGMLSLGCWALVGAIAGAIAGYRYGPWVITAASIEGGVVGLFLGLVWSQFFGG